MKRSCAVCGDPVLVSRQGWQSSAGTHSVDPLTGVRGVGWIAHNSCISHLRATNQWYRLVEACNGDTDQARRILEVV